MEYGTLTIAWGWHEQYGGSASRIFKRRAGRSYWNGKLDVSEQGQQIVNRDEQ